MAMGSRRKGGLCPLPKRWSWILLLRRDLRIPAGQKKIRQMLPMVPAGRNRFLLRQAAELRRSSGTSSWRRSILRTG